MGLFPRDFELRTWLRLFFSVCRKQAPRTPSFLFVVIFDLGAIRTHLSLPLQYASRRLTAASSADHPETKIMPAQCDGKGIHRELVFENGWNGNSVMLVFGAIRKKQPAAICTRVRT